MINSVYLLFICTKFGFNFLLLCFLSLSLTVGTINATCVCLQSAGVSNVWKPSGDTFPADVSVSPDTFCTTELMKLKKAAGMKMFKLGRLLCFSFKPEHLFQVFGNISIE